MNLLPPPSPITSIPALPMWPEHRIGVPKRSVLSPVHTFGASGRRRGGPVAARAPSFTPQHTFSSLGAALVRRGAPVYNPHRVGRVHVQQDRWSD